MTTSPPSGWYPCPTGEPKQRWWDGSAWTAQERPHEATPEPAATERVANSPTIATTSVPTTNVSRPGGTVASPAVPAPMGTPPDPRPAPEMEIEAADTTDGEAPAHRRPLIVAAAAVVGVLVALGAVLTFTEVFGSSLAVGSGVTERTIPAGEQFAVPFVPDVSGPYLLHVDGAGEEVDLAVADDRGERVGEPSPTGLSLDARAGDRYWIFVVNESDRAVQVDITLRRPR